MKYTLVRHSGYTHGGKSTFSRAVELTSVPRRSEEKVLKVGGLLFNSFSKASEAEHEENYPPEVEGMYPQVRGSFSNQKIGEQAIYIPQKKVQ